MFASFGDAMYDLVNALSTFGEIMTTVLFSPLAKVFEMLEQQFTWIDFTVYRTVLLGVLGETGYVELMSSSMLTIALGSMILLYVVFTIIKYVVDLVA